MRNPKYDLHYFYLSRKRELSVNGQRDYLVKLRGKRRELRGCTDNDISEFYRKSLRNAMRIFGNHSRISLFLNRRCGESLEKVAYEIEDSEPEKKAGVFLEAAEHYLKAEKLVGFSSDCSYHLADAYYQAGDCFSKAGMKNKAGKYKSLGFKIFANRMSAQHPQVQCIEIPWSAEGAAESIDNAFKKSKSKDN